MIAIVYLGHSSCLNTPSSSRAQASEGGRTLEEIVVTARRREESLQDTPVTINVFSADEIEARGNRAAHEGECVGVWPGKSGAEPAAGGDHGLRPGAGRDVMVEKSRRPSTVGCDFHELQGLAEIEMPELVGADPMKRRELFALDEEVDRGGERPVAVEARRQGSAGDRLGCAVRLPKEPTFGVRLELKRCDELIRGHIAPRILRAGPRGAR